MPTSPPPPRSGSRAVERAVEVLACFDDGSPELTVSSLSARTGLPVSSAHRIAQALVRGGLLERIEDRDGYRIGARLVSLAVPSLVRLGADRYAPQLQSLASDIGIAASLAVVRDGCALTLFAARPPERFCTIQIPRPRQPAERSVTGRTIAAFDRRTRDSADLTRLRTHGFLADVDHVDPTVFAVAVPVFDEFRRPWGAIGVQARRRRLSDPVVRGMVPAMHRAARLIETRATSTRLEISSR
jgi:DNA-binding IclR family transcriptional regulator